MRRLGCSFLQQGRVRFEWTAGIRRLLPPGDLLRVCHLAVCFDDSAGDTPTWRLETYLPKQARVGEQIRSRINHKLWDHSRSVPVASINHKVGSLPERLLMARSTTKEGSLCERIPQRDTRAIWMQNIRGTDTTLWPCPLPRKESFLAVFFFNVCNVNSVLSFDFCFFFFFNGGGFLMYLKPIVVFLLFSFKEVEEIMVIFIEWERHIPFPKGISPKVNVIVRLGIELAYFEEALVV